MLSYAGVFEFEVASYNPVHLLSEHYVFILSKYDANFRLFSCSTAIVSIPVLNLYQ